MKVTKEKAAENRTALLRAAGKMFREHGIDGVGVAEISKEARLTHGALYAQFRSKDELAAEALKDSVNRLSGRLAAMKNDDAATLSDYLDSYLSKRHRDGLAQGCPLAASGSEIARQDNAVSAAFAEGLKQMVDLVERKLPESASSATRRERALAIVAGEIGALIVARGLAKSNPRLSEEVLAAGRHVFGES